MTHRNDFDDRRAVPRIDYRTTGLAVALEDPDDPASLRALRIWTENFGLSGALIVTREPIVSRMVLLKLLLPQLGDTIVECEIVHQGTRETGGRSCDPMAFTYGLRFCRRLAERDLSDRARHLLAEALARPATFPSAVEQPAESGEAGLLKIEANDSTGNDRTPAEAASQVKRLKSASTRDESRSLVPFLSAIALIVVYVSVVL